MTVIRTGSVQTGSVRTGSVQTGSVQTSAAAVSRPAAGRSRVPTLREERRLIRDGHVIIAGMDEVGRGALAGPVTVGVVLVDGATRSAPVGLRDSKLLTPQARKALAPRLRRWALAWGVGHAEPEEIDALGIIAGLRLAGTRALAQVGVRPGLVLLDGSYDWLTPPVINQPSLLDLLADDDSDTGGDIGIETAADEPPLPVRTMVKADLRCAAVAAASVLAKTERDAIMVERAAAFPQYLWADNKGYSAPEHVLALLSHGPCLQHRVSWRLPGVGYCWNGTQNGTPDVAYGCDDDPTGDESPPA